MLVDGSHPDTIAVTLHGDGLAKDFSCEFYFLRLWGFHAEDHTVAQIFWREDGLGEETCHHTRGKLCLLASFCEAGLGTLHGLCCCFRIEEQWQGLTQEILGVHPGMSKLIVGICLHTANAVLIQELRIVSGVAIQEIVCAHTQPEELDLAVGVLGIVVHPRDIRRSKRAVAAQIGKLIEVAQTIRERLITTT